MRDQKHDQKRKRKREETRQRPGVPGERVKAPVRKEEKEAGKPSVGITPEPVKDETVKVKKIKVVGEDPEPVKVTAKPVGSDEPTTVEEKSVKVKSVKVKKITAKKIENEPEQVKKAKVRKIEDDEPAPVQKKKVKARALPID